ncbi:hypothetical protein VE04_02076 [Pseudogymnoascus sp. 24MN13]|nr:hypothetical protein VE04_02076 [Pseudogymnoascus sp. 24MN13]
MIEETGSHLGSTVVLLALDLSPCLSPRRHDLDENSCRGVPNGRTSIGAAGDKGIGCGASAGSAVDGVSDVRKEHARIDSAVDVLGDGLGSAMGIDNPFGTVRGIGRSHRKKTPGLGLGPVRAKIRRDVGYVGHRDILPDVVWGDV